jgi:ABC-type transport system involved in multi-copper enzyme maturation permease subunit
MSKKRVKTKTVPEKQLAIEESPSDRIINLISQSIRLCWEEVKNSYRTKSFIAFAALMVLPMIIILISYAVTQYPNMFNQVQISLFLNGIYGEDGAILTFRDLFAGTMGISTGLGQGMGGFATIYYLGVPIIAIVTILTSGIIAGDREHGTLPIYFSKPVYKIQLVLTKFFGFAFISLILTGLVYYTMYFIFAFSILGPLGILMEGISYTIYVPNNLTMVTWLFILTVGSVTTLFSSIIDRPILAGVIALIYLLVVSFFSGFLMFFLGSIADALKYLDLGGLATNILNVNILGFEYYQAIWNIISNFGFVAQQLLGQLIDPTTATTILISILLVTLGAACIITQIREVK